MYVNCYNFNFLNETPLRVDNQMLSIIGTSIQMHNLHSYTGPNITLYYMQNLTKRNKNLPRNSAQMLHVTQHKLNNWLVF